MTRTDEAPSNAARAEYMQKHADVINLDEAKEYLLNRLSSTTVEMPISVGVGAN